MSKKALTTSTGEPVADDNNSITVGSREPLTFDNHYVFEKLAHFNRERIPERVVHARGSGAYGTFTATNQEAAKIPALVQGKIRLMQSTVETFQTVKYKYKS
jgi:catalase